jgi:hypothetical protein
MKAWVWSLCLLLSLLAFQAGCSQDNQGGVSGLKNDVDALNSALQVVQTKVGSIDNMKAEIQTLKGSVQSDKDTQQRLMVAIDEALMRLTSDVAAVKQAEKDRYRVIVDLKSRGYIPVNTPAGAFLMVVDSVDPVQEGTRVGLLVGNPLAAAVKGFKLKAEWGTKPPDAGGNATPEAASQAYTQWEKSLAKKEFVFDDRLESGKWNKITCDLAKYAPGDLAYLRVTLEPLEIALQR